MEYIRRTYGVPAKRGGRIAWWQPTAPTIRKTGTITSAKGHYIPPDGGGTVKKGGEIMKKKVDSMMDDNREIKGIWWESDSITAIEVGKFGITKIECYREPGQGAYQPWFKIWRGNKLTDRANGGMIGGLKYS